MEIHLKKKQEKHLGVQDPFGKKKKKWLQG